MVVREHGEIKGIQGFKVQEDGITKVDFADTLNFTGGASVTNVSGVATVDVPESVKYYREDVSAGSASYTLVHEPMTTNSFMVYSDSGILLLLGDDYTYNSATQTITFLSLESNEAAYIFIFSNQ